MLVTTAGPRFRVEEAWDKSGDVEIYFNDATSDDLRERVGRELSHYVPQLVKEERSLFHLERIVDVIFNKMHNNGNLMIHNKRWIWAEEV